MKFAVLILAVAVSCILLAIATESTAYGLESSPLGGRSGLKTKTNFCQGCRSLVSYMTRYNSSSTRNDSKKLFQGFCETLYPVSASSQQGPCPIYVETLFWIMDRMDPVNHCDQIGACGPDDTSDDEPIYGTNDNSISVRGGGVVCEACEQVFTKIQGLLEDPTIVDLIKTRITGFCDYLIIVNEAKECKQMLDGYIDEAIDFARQMQPLEYCQSLQLCSATYSKSLASSSPQRKFAQALANFQGFGIETKTVIGDQVVKDISIPERSVGGLNPNCMFCKVFVKEMFKFLRQNRTEENIRNGLDKICKLVYRNNRLQFQHCESLVATYSRELVQLLADETDPHLVCVLVEQCTYARSSSSKPLVPRIKEREQKQQTESVDLNMLISMLDPSVQPSSIATCVECKIFIQYLRNTIDDPKSVEHMHQWLLSNLCDSLQDKMKKDSCYNMVDTYAAIFFKAIATDLDPKKACIELKACNARARQQINFVNRRPVIELKIRPTVSDVPQAPPATQPKSTVCDQCIQIVTQIDDYLSSHPIDHDVSVLIDQVCNKLPNEYAKNECALMINIFGQDIAQAIATMDSPKQLCSKVMLC